MSFGGGNNQNRMLTVEGGVAIPVINNTGAVSVKGTLVAADSTLNDAVDILQIDAPDPLGVVYQDGIPDGAIMLIVVSGIADVLYSTTAVHGTFARGPVAADASKTAGSAICEALPTSPFATDKHFMEIGHPIETTIVAGLARTVLHFN